MCRKLFALSLSIVGVLAAATAEAQYTSSFSYYNPRTGFSYSQGSAVGSGYASSGFQYGNRTRSYGAGAGYYGRSYWGNNQYNGPAGGYGQSWSYNGYYRR